MSAMEKAPLARESVSAKERFSAVTYVGHPPYVVFRFPAPQVA
jgi:hypothetical protein